MKRKVIQIAGSTQLISLPRKWAQKFDIKKGDELEVSEQSNKLVISTEKELGMNQITIDVKNLNPRMIKWVLTAVHKAGYDEVEILFEDPSIFDIIQERLRELLGYMVIEHSKKRCLVKSISQGIEQEFDSTLRRAFLVTLSMAESALEMLRKGDNPHLKDITSLESTNNQLTNFCHRILNKRGYKDAKKTTYLYVIIMFLESIADSYKDICLYLSRPENAKYVVSKKTISFFEKINKMLSTYYHVFYHRDDRKLASIAEARHTIPGEAYNLMNKNTHQEIVILNLLLSVYQQIVDSMDSFAGLQY